MMAIRRTNMAGSAGAGMLVHLSQGQPVTDSVNIAAAFDRRHDNVLHSIDALILDGTIDRLDFKEIEYLDAMGRKQRAIELGERAALIAMPFIGGKKSRVAQVRLVDAFLSIRSELRKIQSDEWARFRKGASLSHRLMMNTLHETRMSEGKQTTSFHYANEIRLVNRCLFGQQDGIDRDQLSELDLLLLEAVQTRNAVLIAQRHSFLERKEKLAEFVGSMRTKQRVGNEQ